MIACCAQAKHFPRLDGTHTWRGPRSSNQLVVLTSAPKARICKPKLLTSKGETKNARRTAHMQMRKRLAGGQKHG